jgi:hypothetical protein
VKCRANIENSDSRIFRKLEANEEFARSSEQSAATKIINPPIVSRLRNFWS